MKLFPNFVSIYDDVHATKILKRSQEWIIAYSERYVLFKYRIFFHDNYQIVEDPRLTDPRNFHDWTNLQLQWAYAICNSHCYFRLNFIDSTDLMNLNYSTCRLCIWINKLWTATKPCFDPLRNVCFTFFYRVWTILIIRNSFFYTNSDADRDRDDANNAVQQTLNNSNSFSIPKIKRRKSAQKSLSWKLFLKF